MVQTHRTPGGHYTGHKKDPHDPRDYMWQRGSRWHAEAKALPPAVDVCAGLAMPTIFDQAQEGSCTANAWIRHFRWLALKHPTLVPDPRAELSRQAQYYWERALPWNNDANQDAGASTRDGARVLQVTGTCPEADDPYLPQTLYTNPGTKALDDAFHRRIGPYFRLVSVEDLKICLASMQAFCLGIMLTDENASLLDNVGSDGIWNPVLSNAPITEGHDIWIRGYDDSVNGGSLFADNSWSASWGKAGSFYIPYSFLNDYTVSQWDAWTGHLKNE